MQNELPLDQLEELRGIAPYYYDWLTHPFDDPWWDWCDLRNKYGRVHAAVLNFSGWYDDNYGPEGATTNFAGLLQSPRRDFRSSNSSADRSLGARRRVHGKDEIRRAGIWFSGGD